MTIFVTYVAHAWDGYSRPLAVFTSEVEAEKWCKTRNRDYIELELDELVEAQTKEGK